MKRFAVPRRILSAVYLLGVFAVAVPQLAVASVIVVESELRICFVRDDVPGFHTLTVLQKFTPGSIAARFKLEAIGGMTMAYVSETHAWPNSVGTMREGLSVCYGSCQTISVVLGTITYQGFGTSNSCAQFRIVPHPDAETLDVIACDNKPETATTLHFEVWSSIQQSCNWCSPHDPGINYPGTPELFSCQPLPTSHSTWGAIKAFYR